MTRFATLFALLPLAAGLSGCGPTAANNSPPAQPGLPPTSTWKQVDNPDYQNWKQFPVGTVVVRTSTTTSGGTSVTSVERFTLRAKTDASVSVERQNTTSRSDGTYTKVNEPDTRTVAAKLPVHPDLNADDFRKPDLKAKEVGRENVEVLGRAYACTRWEWTNGTEAGPMKVVSWLSDELPGRIAKQQMSVAAINSTTADIVTEVTIPK